MLGEKRNASTVAMSVEEIFDHDRRHFPRLPYEAGIKDGTTRADSFREALAIAKDRGEPISDRELASILGIRSEAVRRLKKGADARILQFEVSRYRAFRVRAEGSYLLNDGGFLFDSQTGSHIDYRKNRA